MGSFGFCFVAGRPIPGVDRHLFALYCVSQGAGIKSEFLNRALSMQWRLSTSQQPQNQTGEWDPRRDKDQVPLCRNMPAEQATCPGMLSACRCLRLPLLRQVSPGGGFGPVTDDGYGVSYMVANEDEVRCAAAHLKHANAPRGVNTCTRFISLAPFGGLRSQLYFHVSSKKSSKVTDAKLFAQRIKDALADMRTVFE